LTIDSFADINEKKNLGQTYAGQTPPPQSNSLLDIVSLAVVVQAWLAGIFIGKITKGAYSGGFMFSILLTVITMVSIGMIQLHVINIGSIIASPPSSSSS